MGTAVRNWELHCVTEVIKYLQNSWQVRPGRETSVWLYNVTRYFQGIVCLAVQGIYIYIYIYISGSCACGKKLRFQWNPRHLRPPSVFTEGIWCTDLTYCKPYRFLHTTPKKATDCRSLDTASKHAVRFTKFPHRLLYLDQPLNGTRVVWDKTSI